jgi:hypothetical protein
VVTVGSSPSSGARALAKAGLLHIAAGDLQFARSRELVRPASMEPARRRRRVPARFAQMRALECRSGARLLRTICERAVRACAHDRNHRPKREQSRHLRRHRTRRRRPGQRRGICARHRARHRRRPRGRRRHLRDRSPRTKAPRPDARLWGAINRVACQAASRWYSWMRPPRRSWRRISPMVAVGGGCAGSGGCSSSARLAVACCSARRRHAARARGGGG